MSDDLIPAVCFYCGEELTEAERMGLEEHDCDEKEDIP